MRPNSLLLLAVLLAGCDGATVGNRSQRSGEPRVSTEATENESEAPQGVGTPMAWRVVDGAAFYGAANEEPVFALRCDRANEQIVFERGGSGTALNLSAGGSGVSLGTREVNGGRVQARTGMNDAVLDAMARSQSHIAVSGGAETLTIPGGVAVRRVVDFCRNPPAPEPTPVENATEAGNAAVPVPPVATPTPAATPPSGR